MKLTQNQFYGLKHQMPREFTSGAQYITLDSKEIYIYDESGLPVLVGGTEQTVIINNDPDAVLELGDIIKSGANITIPGGIKWRISGIIYNIYTDTVFTINLSNIGFIRKDIIVADNYGVIYLIEGVEDTELAVRPNIPSATVLVTEINVTNTDLDYNNTIIGEDYVKKSFSQPVYYNYGGSNVVLPIPSLGNDKLVLNSDATISISGFNLDSITGNSDAEQIYNGKEYTLINSSETYKTLINQASVEIPMMLKDGINLVIPSKESVRFYYENGFFKFLSKSWADLNSKLDKDISTLPAVSLPLLNTDMTIVNRGGVDYKKNIYLDESLLQSMWQFSKFHLMSTNNYPFFGTAIGGGNYTAWYNGSIASRRSHNIYTNGFVTMGTGGSGSNRGFRWQESLQSQASLYEGFTFLGLISPESLTDTTTRVGVLHTNTFSANTLSLNCSCHFEILNEQLQFVTALNGIASYGPQITISVNEWLMLFIEVEKNNNIEKQVRFKVKKVDGTVIYNEVSNANIPTNNSELATYYNQMQVGMITTKNTSTVSEYITSIGYMGYGNEKPNFLNNF